MENHRPHAFVKSSAPATFPCLAALALLCLAAPSGSAANTRTVTSLGDDGGAGTLRTLINASAKGDTINFSVVGTITLADGELAISRNLTILGPAGGITVSGNNASRVFCIVTNAISPNTTVSLSALTIANGRVVGANGDQDRPGEAAQGGGIFNQGTLNLNNCTISSNSVVGGSGVSDVLGHALATDGGAATGGGIANRNTLNLVNCTINGNSARGGKGGNAPGTGGNGANGGLGSGGGIGGVTTVSLSDCTLSGNTVRGGDGGDGGVTGNGGSGGGAFGGGLHSGGCGVHNTIIAGNTGVGGGSGGGGIFGGANGDTGANVGPDVSGAVKSNGYNLIGRTDGSSGWIISGANSDLLGGTTDNTKLIPLLSPLQNNGGPTYTMALQPNSAAIDAGDDAVAGAPLGLLVDQRGRPRKSGAHVDIGAYEISPFTVTNTADGGPGSLRQGIAISAPGDVILFAPNVTGTITLTSGELLIDKNLGIAGPGAAILAISGNSSSRVFEITNATVDISGLGIRDGLASGGVVPSGQRGRDNRGGGILNYGVLNLAACEVFNNTVLGGKGGSSSSLKGSLGGSGEGGGLANYNKLSLDGCHVHDNTVVGGDGGNAATHVPGPGGNGSGGGIYNEGDLAVIASTISSNTAGYGMRGSSPFEGLNGVGFGGGLASVAGTVSNGLSTFANNTANGYGGGVYCNATAFDVVACTLSGNTADLDGNGAGGAGGGIQGLAGVGTLGNTIVAANNAGTAPDLGGSFATHGYNLIGILEGGTGFANGVNHDQAGIQASPINPLLGPLADNGGRTPTMSLLANSPAIDKGNSLGLAGDQRGRARPCDFAGIANAGDGDGSDIGAYELNLPALNIVRAANNVVLSWPAGDAGYTLQSKTDIIPSAIWSNVPIAPVIVAGGNVVTNNEAGGRRFYRLKR